MAAYCLMFLITNMKIRDYASDAIFICYVLVFIVCYGLAAGSISVNASYYFVSNIYTSFRKD